MNNKRKKKGKKRRIKLPVIPALGRLRQEDQGFKTTLGSRVRPCLTHRKGKNSSLRLRLKLKPASKYYYRL
jgi:hypothetical protein